MGSSARFARLLLGSTSGAALIAAGIPVFVLSISEPAEAACTLGEDALGVIVTCDDTFDNTLIYDLPFSELELVPPPPGGPSELATDLSGDDQILLVDVVEGSVLRVRERDADGCCATVTEDLLSLRGGDDDVVVENGSTLVGTIIGSAGEDLFEVDGVSRPGSDVPDEFVGVSFAGGSGDDGILVGPDGSTAALRGSSGDDLFDLSGRITIDDDAEDEIAVSGGSDDDTILIREGADIFGLVSAGSGNDAITMSGGSVRGIAVLGPPDAPGPINFGISGDSGDDTIMLTGGTVEGFLFGGNDDDVIEVSGGTVGDLSTGDDLAGVIGYSGSDEIIVSGAAVVDGFIIGDGDFIVSSTDPELAPPVIPGNDTLTVESGTITGALMGGGADDIITVRGGTIGASGVSGGPFADPLFPGSTDVASIGDVRGNDGDDIIAVEGGTIFGNVGGDAGDDTIAVSGGTIAGDVDGGTGTDSVSYTGGRIGGAIIDAESVSIAGLADSSADPLDTISIEGIDVDVDLADTTFGDTTAGRSSFALSGIDTFSASGSRFALAGEQEVEFLRLAQGAIMEVIGSTTLRSQSGGRGNLSIDDAEINMINGATDDVLRVNDLRVNRATIGIDVNPLNARSDRIDVDGAFVTGPGAGVNNRVAAAFDTAPANNTILVNLVENPSLGTTTVVPIVAIAGDNVDAASVDNNFVVQSNNANDLVLLTLLSTPDGSLFLQTAPDNDGIADASPSAPTNQAVASQNVNLVQDVVTELTNTGTGFSAPSGNRVQVSPTFGVFSMGQAGYAYHDGFGVSPGGGKTPGFHTTNFSVVAAGELDASAEFGLEDIGLKISGFGGYSSTNVDLDGSSSSGDNNSGLFGASVLVSKIQGEGNLNYALLSAAGFFGSTDVFLAATAGSGDYGTQGFLVGGKVGRNMPVAERVRLDLRAGLAYTAFYGDSFTDTAGVAYGNSRLSYGLVSFEPGLSTVIPAGNLVISPFVRGTFQYRIGYENTAKVNGVGFDFDDNDWLVGAQLGATTGLTDNVSLGALIDGRTSGDEYALLGKLSLKFTIPR